LIKTGTVLEKYKTIVLSFYQSHNSFVAKKMIGKSKNVSSSRVTILTTDDLIDNGWQSN